MTRSPIFVGASARRSRISAKRLNLASRFVRASSTSARTRILTVPNSFWSTSVSIARASARIVFAVLAEAPKLAMTTPKRRCADDARAAFVRSPRRYRIPLRYGALVPGRGPPRSRHRGYPRGPHISGDDRDAASSLRGKRCRLRAVHSRLYSSQSMFAGYCDRPRAI